MKPSTIILTAALGPAGINCTASGFLESCYQINFINLEGDLGRSIMLQAHCKTAGSPDHWTQLNLNGCLDWSADTCDFRAPSSGNFTAYCPSCSASTGADFDGTFSCRGPCDAGGEVSKTINLSKRMTLLAPSFPDGRGLELLTQTLADSYVGNVVGDLVC